MNTKKSVLSVISLALFFAVIICSFSGCKFKRLSKKESITQIFVKASENMSETAAMSASSNISVTHKRFNVTTNDTITSDASYIRDKDSYSDYYIGQTIDKGETLSKTSVIYTGGELYFNIGDETADHILYRSTEDADSFSAFLDNILSGDTEDLSPSGFSVVDAKKSGSNVIINMSGPDEKSLSAVDEMFLTVTEMYTESAKATDCTFEIVITGDEKIKYEIVTAQFDCGSDSETLSLTANTDYDTSGSVIVSPPINAGDYKAIGSVPLFWEVVKSTDDILVADNGSFDISLKIEMPFNQYLYENNVVASYDTDKDGLFTFSINVDVVYKVGVQTELGSRIIDYDGYTVKYSENDVSAEEELSQDEAVDYFISMVTGGSADLTFVSGVRSENVDNVKRIYFTYDSSSLSDAVIGSFGNFGLDTESSFTIGNDCEFYYDIDKDGNYAGSGMGYTATVTEGKQKYECKCSYISSRTK